MVNGKNIPNIGKNEEWLEISYVGDENVPLPLKVLLVGLGIKFIWNRLTGENKI